MTKIQQDIGWS